MALLPIPSKSLAASSTSSCGSSSSLYFHLLRSRDFISKTPDFRICYSRRSVRAGNQQSLSAIAPLHATRKKRKLRPSFFDQIRDKWSRRIVSERDKFPWQEAEEEEEEVPDCHRHQFSFGDFAPDSGFESDVPGNSISPSSIRGSEPTKPQFGSEVRGLEQRGKSVESVDGVGEFRAKCVEDGNGVRTEKKAVQVDKMPIGFSGIGDKAVIRDVKTIPFSVNLEGSSNGNRSPVDLSWQREGIVGTAGNGDRKRRRSNTELAEKMLPEHELQRLRNLSLRMPVRTKVGVAGITKALVDSIHRKWRVDEVVKLKFEAPLAFNMRRTHEIIESKTGGLVIWRSGCLIALYRGLAYKLPCVRSYTKQSLASISQHSAEISLGAPYHTSLKNSCSPNSEEILKDLSEELMDLTQSLDQLGPWFKDWSGREPLPVVVEKLPSVVPGYERPSRLVPPHFALGGNRGLQGLAMAMLKLWEKSAIAKIAIKHGLLNTRNKRIAQELKNLTGGTLLSRNEDFIVFYRGNAFVPPSVTEVLKERHKLTELQQDEEELALQLASTSTASKAEGSERPLIAAGTLAKTMEATISCWGSQPDNEDFLNMMEELAFD